MTEFTFALKIPDAAQMIISCSKTKATYRFYAMPTLEENDTNFDEDTYNKILNILISPSIAPKPLPEDLDFQAYVYEGDSQVELPKETLTYDKLEAIINTLIHKYPEYSIIRGFL